MRVWGWMAVAATLAGCTVSAPITVSGDPLLTNVAVTAAPVITPPPQAAMSPMVEIPATPSQPPTFNSNAWKTYDDYGYSFRYPDDWHAADWPVDVIASLNGITLNPNPRAKSSLITPAFSVESRILPAFTCIWLLGTEESFGKSTAAPSEIPVAEPVKITLNTVTWDKIVAQEFKDGVPRSSVMAMLRRDGVVYFLAVTGNQGQPLDTLHMYVDTMLSSWTPKATPQVFPASPLPSPLPTLAAPSPIPTIDPCPALRAARAGRINEITRSYNGQEARIRGSLTAGTPAMINAQISAMQAKKLAEIAAVNAEYAPLFQAGGCE